MPRRAQIVVVAVLIAAGLVLYRLIGAGTGDGVTQLDPARRTFSSNDPIKRACALDDRVLLRIWRGHHDDRSEDVTTIPQEPNYSGSFRVTSHSGPWDYVQTVPLVLYGPNHVEPRGAVEAFASITDVYPTVGALTGVELPERSGEVLSHALTPNQDVPRLVFVMMWDGVGRNVLERHAQAWPHLARLEREGTSYLDATVGSSPSITPATHTNLGAGSFPRAHEVTGIDYRADDGAVRGAFAGKDPSQLVLTTFADEIDLALDNQSRVGMLAWKSWHMGMFGHGILTPGGDADEMVMISPRGKLVGNDKLYSFPASLRRLEPNLETRMDELDREDGVSDGEWKGHDIRAMHDNPAWIRYQQDLLMELLERGDYGLDATPDLFFTNFKVTDIVSHQYNMDSEEEAAVLRAQDEALGVLVEYLEQNVRDFVVIVTADHGHTPSPERTGAWPLQAGEMKSDLDAHFDVPKGASLMRETTAVGPFLNRGTMKVVDVTENDIAKFLNGYTIKQNWTKKELPAGYEDRGGENIFSAAFPSDSIDKVTRCAFGRSKPPPDLQG